jgi:hypothetical protein
MAKVGAGIHAMKMGVPRSGGAIAYEQHTFGHDSLHIVMAGLVPAIHALPRSTRTWMPGTSPSMTTSGEGANAIALPGRED